MTTTDAALFDDPVTERDWQARAWETIRNGRPRYAGLSFDAALAHPQIGGIVRAYAIQLQRNHAAEKARAEREARYGRRVQWNGWAYRPVRAAGRGRA